QPDAGGLDRLVVARELARDPADLLLDVGAPDVGQHVELARQPADHRLFDQVLGEGQLDSDAGHRFSFPIAALRLPERKPSRSSVTDVYPASFTARTSSARRAIAVGRSSASSSIRATSP